MRRFIFLLFLAICFVSANGQKERNYQQAMDAGKILLANGFYKEAINKFFAAEAFDPNKKVEVKKMVDAAFDSILNLKLQAENDKRKAEDLKIIADRKTKELDRKKRENEKTWELAEIQFKKRLEKEEENIALKTAFLINAIAAEILTTDPTVALRIAGKAINMNHDFKLLEHTANKIYQENSFYKIIGKPERNSTDSAVSVAYSFAGVISFASSIEARKNNTDSVDKKTSFLIKQREKINMESSKLIKDEHISEAISKSGDKILYGYKNGIARLWDTTGKMIMEFKGHTGKVSVVGFSKTDPEEIITYSSEDRTVRSWYYHINRNIEFTGHTGSVNTLAFSKSDYTVLTGSTDGTARIWDLDGKMKTEFKRKSEDVNILEFSPRGDKFLTGSNDSTARLWDSHSGSLIREFRENDIIYSVCFSKTGDSILTGLADGTVRLWNLHGKNLNTFKGHSKSVFSVAFSPAGGKILVNSMDNTASLWDLANIKLIKEFKGEISIANFSPTGDSIITGSLDSIVKLWDTKRLMVLNTIKNNSAVYDVSFSPDGNSILIVNDNLDHTIHDLKNKTLIKLEDIDSKIYSAAFSPDGKKILLGFVDGSMILRELKTGDILKTFRDSTFSGSIISVSFSPTGDSILSGSSDGIANLWDVKTGNSLQTFHIPAKIPIYNVKFSPDGKTIGMGDPFINRTYELTGLDRKFKMIFKSYESPILSAAYSPDDKMILTGSEDGSTILWDVNKGNIIHKFKGHTEAVNAVAFSPSGEKFLTGSSDGTAVLWDIKTGDTLKTFKQALGNYYSEVLSVAFSNDGKKILTGNLNGISVLWDLDKGSILQSYEGHTGDVYSLAFSPDGENFLSGSSDGSAILWNLKTKRIIQVFLINVGEIYSVAFSPDGNTILTGSSEGNATLWGLNGSPIQKFPEKEEDQLYAIYSVAFSNDGKRILTGTSMGNITLWNLTTTFDNFLKSDKIEALSQEQNEKIDLFTDSYDIGEISIPDLRKFIRSFNIDSDFDVDLITMIEYKYGAGGVIELISPGKWKESNLDGINYFVEVKRDESGIYLNDESRFIKLLIDLKNKIIYIGWDSLSNSKLYDIKNYY